jgi:hypothetical protein
MIFQATKKPDASAVTVRCHARQSGFPFWNRNFPPLSSGRFSFYCCFIPITQELDYIFYRDVKIIFWWAVLSSGGFKVKVKKGYFFPTLVMAGQRLFR